MRKYVARFLGVMLLVALLNVSEALAAGQAELSVSSGSGAAGEQVEILVSISGNTGMMSGKVSLEWDRDALELVRVERDGYLFANGLGEDNPAEGLSNFISTTAQSQDGVLYKAVFAIKDTAAAGNYPITCSSGTKLGKQIGEAGSSTEYMNLSFVDGAITVTSHEHVWDNGVVTKKATAEEKGIITYTCLTGGETKEEEFALVYEEPVITEGTVDEADQEKLNSVAVTGFEEAEGIVYLDITLTGSADNKQSFEELNENTMPEEGIKVVIPYPEGTSAAEYDFVILHLLKNGTVETFIPENITEGANGLEITVRSASPFAVKYKKAKETEEMSSPETSAEETTAMPSSEAETTPSEASAQETTASETKASQPSQDSPQNVTGGAAKTGDTGMASLWGCVGALCMGGFLFLRKKLKV